MSLFDVDKGSENRGAPKPNHTDQLVSGAVKSHQTVSTTYKTDASSENARVQQQNTRILAVDSDDVPVVSFGQQEDGSLGLRVAKPGVDVTTNSDLSQLIFNSSQNTFKIVYTSSVTAIPSSGSATSTVTIPHGLSFVPTIVAFATISGIYAPVPSIGVNTTTGAVTAMVNATVDATNVYLIATYPGSTVPSGNSIKYYLLQETAN